MGVKPRAINLRIERVVFHGLSETEREQFIKTLHADLTARLQEPAVLESIGRGRTLDRLDAGAEHVGNRGAGSAAARRATTSILRSVTR